jgi:hypothetical protein
MALTKENGTIVANANTYASWADLQAFCTLYGDTAPASQAIGEGLLLKAMDKLAEYQGRWQGWRVSPDQALDWPRADVWRDGYLLASNAIPRELFYAQMRLALDAQSVELQPTIEPSTPGPVIEETIDVITLKYANPSNVRSVSAFARAEALLAVLLTRNGLFAVRA